MEWGGGGGGERKGSKTSSGEGLFHYLSPGGRGQKFWLNQIKMYLQVN